MNAEPQVSFIIPVYNEEQNIANVLRDLHQALKNHPEWSWEVIVVEDGSRDNTRNVLLDEVKKYTRTQLILHDKNQGYTPSLRDGIRQARGKFLMYIGADEEFDCSELPSFMKLMLEESHNPGNVVLGVRWQRNAYQLGRFFLSIIYIFLLNFLFKMRINDYNWSQAWPRDFFEKVQLRSKSLFILPEIIIRARDLNYPIKEIPSNHRGRRTGKSSVNFRIMGSALLEAFSFWRYRNSTGYVPTR